MTRKRPTRLWFVIRHDGSTTGQHWHCKGNAQAWIDCAGDDTYSVHQFDLVPVRRRKPGKKARKRA